jgi:formate hydrogenlyase subunit 4
MTLLTGLVTQLLHIALMAATAPTLIGLHGWMRARLAGRAGASPLQPWRDLIRLLRKQTVLAESASNVTIDAPVACAAATAVAACLVPSFALGMTFAPFADLLLISGLLIAARASLALAAMDAGTAVGGMAASRTMLFGTLVEPALLLVLFVVALLAGSLDLDVVAALQIENGADWRTGVGLALAATSLVALIDVMRREALAMDLGGRDLALIEVSDALRLLVWFNLIGAMFLPFGMAGADAGPIAWAVGIITWLIRTLLAATLLALLHSGLGRIGLVRAAQVLGVAVLFGLLATLFLLADMGAA